MTAFEPNAHPDVVAAKARGALEFVAVDRSAPWPDEALLAATKLYPRPARLADGRWVGTRKVLDPAHGELVILDGDQVRVIEFPYGWEPDSPTISPSGDRVLLKVKVEGRGQVVEHALDGSGDWEIIATAQVPGRPSHLYGQTENLWGADYADDDTVVLAVAAGTDNQLLLLRRTPTGWRELDNIKHKGLDAVCRGRFVASYDGKGVESFGIVGNDTAMQFVKLGKLAKLFMFVDPADTRATLWGHQGVGKNGHVLVGAEAALAGKKPKPRKKGTLLAPRYAPGSQPSAASHEAMEQHFGHDYLARHIRATTHSRAGRIIASAPGRTLIGHAGKVVEVAGVDVRFIHPHAERGIGWDSIKAQIFLVDLVTGEKSKPLADNVARAFFVSVGDSVHLAVQTKDDQLALFGDPTPGQPLTDASMRMPTEGAQFYPGPVGYVTRVAPGTKPKTWSLALWSIAADGSGLAHAVELVLPGTRYAGSQCAASVIGDACMIVSFATDPYCFEIPTP